MFIKYNANPVGRRTSDCVIRAISVLTGKTWDETYIEIFNWGFMLKDMPSVNNLWGSYLRFNGFERINLPDTCPDCYTVRQFCYDYPEGKYMLATGTHVIAVIDGNYYDTWDSGDEVPISYWKKGELKHASAY